MLFQCGDRKDNRSVSIQAGNLRPRHFCKVHGRDLEGVNEQFSMPKRPGSPKAFPMTRLYGATDSLANDLGESGQSGAVGTISDVEMVGNPFPNCDRCKRGEMPEPRENQRSETLPHAPPPGVSMRRIVPGSTVPLKLLPRSENTNSPGRRSRFRPHCPACPPFIP